MTFNDLLTTKGLDPREVAVLRHRPSESALRKHLPWLAAEKPDVFNAYQQTQGDTLEAVLKRLKLVASFIGTESGRATFAGLYSIDGSRPITRQEYWDIPANNELRALGMHGFTDDNPRKTVEWFDLTATEFYAQWKGRLIVSWPPPERSWWRRAHRNVFPVLAILEESALEKALPAWDQIDLSWGELRLLPRRLREKLSEWRAIYYIFDTSDHMGYVGSAYGLENLLGRWLNYAERGHGGNRLLRGRDPATFRFSILQRVSPDMDAADVIRLEGSWKERLHTRSPHGLNDN